ncbi:MULTISPECIES: DUF6913 domain-containing protein [unclassified Tenacibaculum]|uniref:DUF6913 domain-containing protein n=1 Tax=unclassified Tenacibaculum TaxID=2635139 RepID=UPI001F184729|nr:MULTISPECIES: hypothetical protein [unclassified Tenacibaculum]MCF2873944.1 hypothetical protein [Tenacibaculum sp. Cn5-1]MCF2934525.1 hypothetical protein [Tenacibaculum sp. Cn5-34]MCG7510735.1 hypothetical protein [Tenacibaculum sp. Cn5-46]
MISKFKYKSIQKAYNGFVDKNIHKNHKSNLIKKVAILLDNESLVNVMISNLTSKLPFKKENITVLIFREYSKKDEESPLFFSDNDFGFNASLKSDNLKEFVKKEYDLLINYTKTPNLYTNMVTLLSQADLKAGFANIDDRLYDIVISDEGQNEAILNQELKKYLTILNKI